MPSLVATASTPARKPFVRTHYVRINSSTSTSCIGGVVLNFDGTDCLKDFGLKMFDKGFIRPFGNNC